MKKILSTTLLIIACTCIIAQTNNQTLYLLFEFMEVSEENNASYLEVEEFWTKIHKQRIATGDITGWDLWKLTPSGSAQGSQYMTTTLFTSLESMLRGIPGNKFNAFVENAYPGMSEADLQKMWKKTSDSRSLAHQIFCKQINGVGTTEEMQVGTFMKFDVMKQLDSSYPIMEDQIFKPWHKQLVEDGKIMNWGLIEVLLPIGSSAYGSHVTYSMYNNMSQLAESMEHWIGEMDLKTELSIQDGLKTRDWRDVKIAQLIMMVR